MTATQTAHRLVTRPDVTSEELEALPTCLTSYRVGRRGGMMQANEQGCSLARLFRDLGVATSIEQYLIMRIIVEWFADQGDFQYTNLNVYEGEGKEASWTVGLRLSDYPTYKSQEKEMLTLLLHLDAELDGSITADLEPKTPNSRQWFFTIKADKS